MIMSTGREALPDVVCRVCSGALRHKWTMKVLDRYEADYFECLRCGCLQIPNPHWLNEAYCDEGKPIAVNPDSGRFCRNFSAYVRLRALEYAGLFGGPLRVLDYGGGSGLLAAMLRLANCKCRQFDPYCQVPMFAPELAFATQEEIPPGGFNAVASLEVFEHLCDPVDVIRTLAQYVEPTGAIVLSTQLYKPDVHTSDWPYLSRLAGQHITFYTRKAIRILADIAGFPNICLFPSDDGFLILLTRCHRSEAAACLVQATQALQNTGLIAKWTSTAWDIQQHADFTICPQPLFVE